MTSWNVLQCEVGRYCCREAGDNNNCCSNSSAVISTNIGTLLLATAPSTATSVSPAGTSSPAGTGSNGSVANVACPVDKTALVGGAVGGALGIALLGSCSAFAFIIWRQRIKMRHLLKAESNVSEHLVVKDHSQPLHLNDRTNVLPQELLIDRRVELG